MFVAEPQTCSHQVGSIPFSVGQQRDMTRIKLIQWRAALVAESIL